MTLLERLPHTVSHSRQKYSRDNYLGAISEDESLATGVRAWVQNASMNEITEFQKQDQIVSHKVFYKTDPSLRPGDEITVTAGPSFIGRVFSFKCITDTSAGLGRVWRCMVDEANNEYKTFSGT
jgi:hypothetical protein